MIVPRHAGVLSALGMLLADRKRDYSASVLGRVDFEGQFRALEKRARKDLRGAELARFADLRYAGQSYELTLPWNASFHEAHRKEYGYADPKRAVEVVALRIRAVERVPRLKLAGRDRRKNKEPVLGPALIADYGWTTYVAKGWNYVVDAAGNLIIKR